MRRSLKPQRGVALIALMAVLALGASWYLVSALSTPVNRTAIDYAHNAALLQQAKAALVGWSALQAIQGNEENPGRLPCPEAAGYIGGASEGVAAGSCTLPAVGRLPWRTLGLDKLRDASGEPLWYVVSAGWGRTGSSYVLNSNTAGQLTVDSSTAVALIVAPGAPIQVQTSANCTARTQTRTLPSPSIDLRDYLECQNATSPADATFATSGPSGSFNDQVVSVTAKDVWSVVEGAVAARIQRDVVPQLQSIYAATQWGSTAADPVFPFAVPFADPSASTFKGTAGTTQGLLPINAYTCSALTTGRCDTSFVEWETSGITVTKLSGTANLSSSNCAASSTSQVSCNITYSRTCITLLDVLCTGTINVAVAASAEKAGMTMRTFTTSGITGFTAITSSNTPIASTGAANASIQGSLPDATCDPVWWWFLSRFVCTASTTTTVTVPITVFQDHAFLNPSSSQAWYWFLANNWHHLTYYAVAPSHAPSGATHNCQSAGDCLTITGGSTSSNVRATLVLAGRSVTGTTRPNANLNDFLDSSANQDGNTAFEQLKPGRTFNDRFATLGNY